VIASGVAPLAGVGIIVLKSSLVLAIGWGITRALRGAPAACRYMIWLSAIVGALFVPVVDHFAPINVTVLPAVVDSRAPASSALPDAAAVKRSESRDGQLPVAAPVRTRTPGARTRWPSVMQSVGAVWAIVAFLLLARFALGILAVRRLVRRARVIESADWTRVLVEAARRISVAATTRLVMSDQVETAFTFDALAPAIVLPVSAQEWPNARRRAVLLHELAHIRRHDLVGHVIGALACALGWFNPFMWMAARELRIESELASDEIVLGAGVRPSEYAQHLLDIVTSFGRRAPSAAVAIARPNELEGRLRAILDPARRRAALPRRAIGAWAASLLLAAMCIGAVVPVRRTRSAAPVASQVEHSESESSASTLARHQTTTLAPVKRPEFGGGSVRTAVRLPKGAQADSIATKRIAAATLIDTPSGDSAGGIPTRVVRRPINPPGPASTDSLFETLFSGISLTQDQATHAHALLVGLQAAQQTQNTNTMKRRQEVMPVLQPHLDSVLLALPTNATDVETLRSRLAQALPGDGLYSRLFDGIAMSSDQEAAARAAILEFQHDVRALMPPPEPPILGIRRNPTRVVMRPPSDSAFMALVSSDADRATLQSRISVAFPPSRSPN
jgi:beta-lactamase regulating signal transducer with metallopeptidase domain